MFKIRYGLLLLRMIVRSNGCFKNRNLLLNRLQYLNQIFFFELGHLSLS